MARRSEVQPWPVVTALTTEADKAIAELTKRADALKRLRRAAANLPDGDVDAAADAALTAWRLTYELRHAAREAENAAVVLARALAVPFSALGDAVGMPATNVNKLYGAAITARTNAATNLGKPTPG